MRRSLLNLLLLTCAACRPLPSLEELLDHDGDGALFDADCDDRDPDLHPGAAELPYDGIDQDCAPATPDDDLDGDGFGRDADCDDSTASRSPGEADGTRDGVDQNCDGVDGTDLDGDAVASLATGGQDCDDEDPGVFPGSQETCDGRDEDCDGEVDEDAIGLLALYEDADQDGYGGPGRAVWACELSAGLALSDDDCDDTDPTVNPGATERCDDGDIDEDCDGLTDDLDGSADPATTSRWYADDDSDGYGGGEGALACDGVFDRADDCDDTDPTVNPGATERCDDEDIDEDCDGLADDLDGSADPATMTRWYPDLDGDGYGSASGTTLSTCDPPPEMSTSNLDCDDTDHTIHPDAEELPGDEVDSDCDAMEICMLDEDGDGVPADETVLSRDPDCQDSGETVASDTIDCDDADATVYPGAEEICEDGRVNDCESGSESLPYADAMETCAWSGTSSLADAGRVLNGSAKQDYLGYALAGGADVDGDGLDDLLIGAFGADGGGSAAGAAYLWSGSDAPDGVSEASDLTIDGIYSRQAGQAVALGDLDGDGYAEIVVGAPSEISFSTPLAGGAYLFWGPLDADASVDEADLVLDASTSYGYAGKSLRIAEDLDGDGARELLVGAPGSSGRGAGAAYLVSGPASGALALETDATVFSGVSTSDYAGQDMDAGDIDGDGVADLAVGAMGLDFDTYSVCGGVYVLFGPVEASLTLSDADGVLMASSNAYAGRSVRASGDLDGDGLADLAVGAYGESGGRVYVVTAPRPGSSALSDATATLAAASTGDHFGSALDLAGDVDLDGLQDLLVGAQSESTVASGAGAAYLFLGPLSGVVSATDARATWRGADKSDFAGAAVAGAGDMDGDGIPDLAMGAYLSDLDATNTDAGATYLIFGWSY